MAVAPRVVKTEEVKPGIGSSESQTTNPDAKPRVSKSEEVKPKKPTAEK